jgi:hypothetical protein
MKCGRDVGSAPRSLEGFQVRKTTDKECGRACTSRDPTRKVILVRQDYWDKWPASARQMAINHEAAHSLLNTDCETCADTLAGAMGKGQGLTKASVVEGARQIVGDVRPTAPIAALKGYENA